MRLPALQNRLVKPKPHKSGPDYTLPLRMQAWGTKSAISRERMRLKYLFWKRALRSRNVWKLAIRSTVSVAAGQMLLLRSVTLHHFWLALLIPISTLLVSITAIASTCVKYHLTEVTLGQN